MNGRSSFEKGMEVLEQGGKNAVQQIKSTVQSQITGKQPNPQGSQQPKLDNLKSQILGSGSTDSLKLDTVKSQITGIIDSPKKPGQNDQVQNILGLNQDEDTKFRNDLYGLPNDPKKIQQMQQTLDPKSLAQINQNDQQKQVDIKKHLEMYYVPEFQQKPEQLRKQEEQQKMQEEHVEEQQKMQEIQIVERRKDNDVALVRAITKTEAKIGSG